MERGRGCKGWEWIWFGLVMWMSRIVDEKFQVGELFLPWPLRWGFGDMFESWLGASM